MVEKPPRQPVGPEPEFAGLWPDLVEKVAPSLQAIFGLGGDQRKGLASNQEDCLPCCVLECAAGGCKIAFASRGFERRMGYASGRSLGSDLGLLEIKAPGLNKLINERELNRIQEFCMRGCEAEPNASIVAFVLHEKASGHRFWDLMRLQYVTLQAKQYIFCANCVLDLPLPTVISQARYLPDEQLDEAQFSCLLDALAEFLGQLRPHVRKKVSESIEELRDMVFRSVLSFMKANTSEFEGDHWVPLVGEDKTHAFQQDVKWSGIFAQVRNSLYKVYEVSDRHEEVVACAVSDPTGEDCPLVYISREFEKLTGYNREWVLGRNCRFLQPNHSWRNAAFNKEELRLMREFCKEPQPKHTRIVNLLVNERKDGYPFWNLLVMEHIEVAVDPKRSIGGVDRRRYIFGVQTNLTYQFHRLSELLAMDARGLSELKRLRQVFRKQEGALQTQSLNTFARDCISMWASCFPAAVELPRFSLSQPRGQAKTLFSTVGLEVDSRNVIEIIPQALEDGVRHFYLTFPPAATMEMNDARMNEMEMTLLSLKVAQTLAGLSKTFLHYLRGAITLSLVTPPQMVNFSEEIFKSVRSNGYDIGFWLLDVRGADVKQSKASECWQFMSEIWRRGEVQGLGLCGASRELYENVQHMQDVAPVTVVSIELFPGKPLLEYKYLMAPNTSHIAVIAFNVFGPKQSLLELEEVKDEAVRRRTDASMLLMKWCSSQVDGLMVPVTVLGAARSQKRASDPGFQMSPESSETSRVGQSASDASTMRSEPSTGEANVHRSFTKAFNKVVVADDFARVVGNSEAFEMMRRRSSGPGQLLPPVGSRSRSTTLTCDSLPSPSSPTRAQRGFASRSPTRDKRASASRSPAPPHRRLPIDVLATDAARRSSAGDAATRESSRTPDASSATLTSSAPSFTQQISCSLFAAAGRAPSPRDSPCPRHASQGTEVSLSPRRRGGSEPQATKPQLAKPLNLEPLQLTKASPLAPSVALTPPTDSLAVIGAPALIPTPPTDQPPPNAFRRQHPKRGSDPEEVEGSRPNSDKLTEPIRPRSRPTSGRLQRSAKPKLSERSSFGSDHSDANSYQARIVSKLAAKGVGVRDIAEAVELEEKEVHVLLDRSGKLGA